KCWGYKANEYVPANLRNPKMISAGSDHTCAIDDEGVKCWGANYYGQTDVPANLKNPRMISAGSDHTCAIDDEGLKCWGEKHSNINLNPSQYFYQEKSFPIDYANEILNNMADTPEIEYSLQYIKELITQSFLKGVDIESAPIILSNTKNYKLLMIQNFLVSKKTLATRTSTQLRFVLDVMASSLNSSKYLLSDNSKQIVDKLKVSFAALLSEDNITIQAATDLITLTLNQTTLINEMAASHRLVGIKTFYDWAYTYTTTGIADPDLK
ncbi:MAG: RCC1 domain-containing protein, partial [Bacteriovorax sp.]|nr:RCC1 domain-containing protein [Bacteriovorax sp.]